MATNTIVVYTFFQGKQLSLFSRSFYAVSTIAYTNIFSRRPDGLELSALDWTWKRISLPDIIDMSALEASPFHGIALDKSSLTSSSLLSSLFCC